MKVINFFESDKQKHWLEEIRRSDWGAGVFLYDLLSKGTFFEAVGEGSKVLLLTDGDELISFCTYAKKDDIQPTGLLLGWDLCIPFRNTEDIVMSESYSRK